MIERAERRIRRRVAEKMVERAVRELVAAGTVYLRVLRDEAADVISVDFVPASRVEPRRRSRRHRAVVIRALPHRDGVLLAIWAGYCLGVVGAVAFVLR